MRRRVTASCMCSVLLGAVVVAFAHTPQPSYAVANTWRLFDATPGCVNAVRQVRIDAAGKAVVERTIARGRAGHALSVLDARPRQVLFTDFDCRRNTSAVKLAVLGSSIKVTTIRRPSHQFFEGAFDSTGRAAYVGWDADGQVRVDRIALATREVTASKSWTGLGFLDGLDTGAGRDVFLQVSTGALSDHAATRVMDWYGSQLSQYMIRRGKASMHMAVSTRSVVGLATDEPPGRVYFKRWAGYPFSRAAICGGDSPRSFTWLEHRVALASCMTGSGSTRYEIVDLRGTTRKTVRLRGFWGIEPVGLG